MFTETNSLQIELLKHFCQGTQELSHSSSAITVLASNSHLAFTSSVSTDVSIRILPYIVRLRLLVGFICHTFPCFAPFFPVYFLKLYYVHVTLLWLLTCVSLFQKVSFEWCFDVFSPSFLSSQTPAGRGGWPPFLSLFLPEVSSC